MMSQENGDAKVLRAVIDLQEKFGSMETKLDVLISLGQNNQVELRGNHKELSGKIDELGADIKEIKDLIKGYKGNKGPIF